jgi:hypothetical protein
VSLGPNLPDRYGGSGPPYWHALASNRISNTLRRSIGSRRKSLPFEQVRRTGRRARRCGAGAALEDRHALVIATDRLAFDQP